MFVELIEVLRCPRDHEETRLIASATRTVDRHIRDGVLGCPHCHAEFPIVEGVARFVEALPPPREEAPDAEAAMRLAAFLELVDAGGFALLFGRWGSHADQLRRISDAPVMLVNPATRAIGDVAGTIMTDERLPLAPRSARGAALDDSTSSALAESAVRSVQPGGRIVGPIGLTVPDGLQELVRDDSLWVAERTAAPDAAPRLTVLQRSKR
jgi:uncharacterized protein YbaR (Trm112 family)